MFARIAYALAVAAFLIVPIGNAKAAPQVLAVLSSSSGIPFICDAGQCRAELTTYCLQRDREPPQYDEAYRPGRASDFALVTTDGDGVQSRLPTGENVVFSGNRGFTSAHAVIPKVIVARHGIVSATIEVAENASLVPVPVAVDYRPLTDEDVSTATGPLRQLGDRIVDASKSAAAAQVLMRVSSRFAQATKFQHNKLPGLWHSVRREVQTDLRHPSGLKIARNVYDRCVTKANTQQSYWPPSASSNEPHSAAEFASNMLQCLHRNHDNIVRDINVTYWNSLAGS